MGAAGPFPSSAPFDSATWRQGALTVLMRKEREERNVSETDFDIIVVGSGCAGAVAAYTAA